MIASGRGKVIIGAHSVIPYPSHTLNPSTSKVSPVAGLSAAPPLTRYSSDPPNLRCTDPNRSFENFGERTRRASANRPRATGLASMRSRRARFRRS